MTRSLQGQRVLVTGAGGFIGSHLVEKLVDTGATVRAFVRYNSRGDRGLLHFIRPEIFSQIEVVAGDLRDLPTVNAAVEGCSLVFHLGALISIPYSYKHPVEVAETNLLGTLNVLLACVEKNVNRLVHTSTSEVYGTARTVPINETHILQGQSPYSASKIGADKMAESFYCAYGLPVVTVRPFNTYGPRQSARAVIPTIIVQALNQPLIHLGNLDTTRDFTYVDDTVNGFICASLADHVEGRVFNLGTGNDIRIGDLALKVIQKVGRKVEISVDEARLRPQVSEVQRLLSDNSLARETIGWFPEISLDEGLDRTIHWIRKHLEHYNGKSYVF